VYAIAVDGALAGFPAHGQKPGAENPCTKKEGSVLKSQAFCGRIHTFLQAPVQRFRAKKIALFRGFLFCIYYIIAWGGGGGYTSYPGIFFAFFAKKKHGLGPSGAGHQEKRRIGDSQNGI
jgi:hypothetical protein